MTPTQTLHQAEKDFHDLHTDAPMDACVRRCKLQVIQHTMRKLVDGLIVTVAKRRVAVQRPDYSKAMVSKERTQEKLIATCQTFLEKLAAKHDRLTMSHDALTCFTCRHRALTRTFDLADRAAACELQKGRNAEIVAYKALLVARRISIEKQAAERWEYHCMHN